MTSVRRVQIPEAWTPFLRRALVLILAGFVLSIGVSIYEMRHTQAEVRLIVERGLASIELTSRVARDIDKERLLYDAHINERERVGMERIEKELADTETRIENTSQAYEPTIADEVERTEWQELQARIASVRAEAKRAIALSRQNQDVQARAVLSDLEPEFAAIDQRIDDLVRLNRERADQEVADIRALQRIEVILLTALSLAWITFALAIARWVTRLVNRRESQMRQVTSLLQERNRELDAFAGRVAHDLRGPLTAINLAAFMKEGSPEDTARAVFRRGVRRMEAIIEDLLTLSRISAQAASTTCQTAKVAASVEEDLRPKVEAVGGVLRVEAAAATAPCSEGLLRQALWNLGENAVKYRRSGVRLEVIIRGRITPDAYEFSVRDNGTGMSASEAQHAFDPFFRGEGVRSTEGTGLGLSIVRRVVEASGGAVSVESMPDRGSTFKIRLPLAADKAA
jgi:signal transduction histidine kinase